MLALQIKTNIYLSFQDDILFPQNLAFRSLRKYAFNCITIQLVNALKGIEDKGDKISRVGPTVILFRSFLYFYVAPFFSPFLRGSKKEFRFVSRFGNEAKNIFSPNGQGKDRNETVIASFSTCTFPFID